MDKNVIALALLGLGASSVAQAQSSVTIYGIVDMGMSYMSNVKKAGINENASRFGMDSGTVSSSRIGFKGVEDLGGGLKALFVLENGFNGANGQKGAHANNIDRTSTGRNDNSVRYDTNNRGGFTGSLYYAFGEVAGQISAG